MAKFSIDKTYKVGDRVSYNNLYYECLVDGPDTSSTPDEKRYWNESFIELEDVVTKAFISGISANKMTKDSTKEIKIYGYYFDSSIEVEIANCIINITDITPGEITIEAQAGSVISINDISVTKAGVINDGEQLTLEILEEISGNGDAGEFLTVFSNKKGEKLWGKKWELEIFGNVNKVDSYFVSSNSGTPSGNTGPETGADGSYYAFVETSNPNNGDGQYGTATTDNFKNIQSIEFDYHMYGSGMGDLTIQGHNGSSWSDVHVLSGQQQASQNDDWLHANISCSSFEKIRFMFNYPTFATNYMADICIDNIKIIST